MSAKAPHSADPRPSASAAGTSQKTLASPARVDGIGLFTGKKSVVVIHPAPTGHGIAFQRTDIPGSAPIPAHASNVIARPRRTALGTASASVETVEHILSALAGLGIDNALIHVEGPEIPMGDGSASPFVEAITRAGIIDQQTRRAFIAPPAPLSVQDGPATITYSPPPPGAAEGTLELTYVLDYADAAGLPRQAYTCTISPQHFAREVAPARTFSTQAEAEAASRAGMFAHVSPRDMLVIGPSGPIDNAYRFTDEPARHKLLDLLGDLMLAGGPVAGRIVAVRSGHTLNQSMARALAEACASQSNPTTCNTAMSPSTLTPPGPTASTTPATPALDVRQIAGILPHRYPMLMVDRVLTMESGKHAVGIKNVSINEPFFVGHYPQAPIMPGVLICEAMAQLAGLMLKDVLAHQGKVALLLAMDEVRWRRAVVPGDQLVLEATSNKANARMADVSCKASVEGQLAAEARLKFMVVDPAQVGPAGTAS